METFTSVTPILLWGVIPIITGLLAMRKGYNFFLWLLAAGILGLVILAFLPFANKPEAPPEEQTSLKKTGNIVGATLAVVGILFALVRFFGQP